MGQAIGDVDNSPNFEDLMAFVANDPGQIRFDGDEVDGLYSPQWIRFQKITKSSEIKPRSRDAINEI